MRTQRLESVGTLASGIAHDLNNVFTPIVMGLNLIGTQRMDPDQRAILDTMRASAQRGAQLVKQVLSFARGQAGHRVQVRPAEVVYELERMMRETFPRSIRISIQVGERLPAMGRAVLGDGPSDAQVIETSRFLYNVVRGLALDQDLLDAMPVEHSGAAAFDAQRDELVRVLAASLSR